MVAGAYQPPISDPFRNLCLDPAAGPDKVLSAWWLATAFSQLCVKRILLIHVASKICLFIYLYVYLDGIGVLATRFGPTFRHTIALKLSDSGGFAP